MEKKTMNKIMPYIDSVHYLCVEASKEKLPVVEHILKYALQNIKAYSIQQKPEN